ncbi:MAG: hypothetical protein L3K19_03315 [Thermoplasmata archaeon]|nr:hypothetical protein [Thermoplasmata archaeon]
MRRAAVAGPVGPRAAGALAIFVVVVLLVESLLVVGLGSIPILQVQLTSERIPPQGLQTSITLTAGLHPLSVHVGLVPGSPLNNPDTTVMVFADPQYHPLYGAFNDVYGVAVRLGSYLTLEHSRLQIVVVDAPSLPGMLQAHPHAFLVMAGTGVIPDSLFSLYSNQLPQWIRSGGVLIWAGGPLGYVEGHPTPGVGTGFAYDSLGWTGQQKLVGYALTDPWSVGLPAAARPMPFSNLTYSSSYAQALGVQYSASPAGANLTALTAHEGVSIGYVGLSPNGSAPRTSLAWVPVGSGGVFFFGGAVFAPTIGAVPQAAVSLAEDIALLLSLAFRPAAGAVAFQDLSMAASERTTVTLQIPDAPVGAIVVVHSEFQGSVLFFWGENLPLPGAISPSYVVPAATPGWRSAIARRSR